MAKTHLIQFLATCMIFFLPTTGVEAQQTLYAVDSVSNLYTVDPADGSTTFVGSMGIDGISSMAFNPITGNLYAGTGGSSSTKSTIYIVDPVRGTATLLGPTNHGANWAIPGLSFHSDGTLYGYLEDEDELGTISLLNGRATVLGQPEGSPVYLGGNGIEFDSRDVLYHVNMDGLYIIDPVPPTNHTLIASLNYIGFPTLSDPKPNALSFDELGVLYTTINDGSSHSGPTYLATIDTVRGDVSYIGTTLNGLDGLAWSPGPLEIPILNLWGFSFILMLSMFMVVFSTLQRCS